MNASCSWGAHAPSRVPTGAPASRPCGIPPFKKARVPAYSRIFQPLPLGGRGVSNGGFYTAVSGSPGNERTCRGLRNLGTPCGIRLPSPIANRKSKIPPCPHHSHPSPPLKFGGSSLFPVEKNALVRQCAV